MKMTTGIALAKATKKSDGTVFWRLGLLYEQGVRTFSQEGSRAVFKTFKGTVVSVCQRTKSSDSVNNRTKLSSTSELYVNKALYEIDEQTLDILISEGIQKMRFETLRGFRDYEYDHDVLGAYLAAEKREIEGMANFGSDF